VQPNKRVKITEIVSLEQLSKLRVQLDRCNRQGGAVAWRSGWRQCEVVHLGCQVYVVGETTTPLIRSTDLFIACSGSGSTETVRAIAATAKALLSIPCISITMRLEPTIYVNRIAVRVIKKLGVPCER